jgi:hypothetical protein
VNAFTASQLAKSLYCRHCRNAQSGFVDWNSDAMLAAFMELTSVCSQHGISVYVYLQALFEQAVRENAKSLPRFPTDFAGPRAIAAFKRWAVSNINTYGNYAGSDPKAAKAAKRQSALTAVVTIMLSEGYDAAVSSAKEYRVNLSAPTDTDDAVIALYESLLSVNPALTRSFLMPRKSWTWREVDQAVTRLRS